MKELRTFECFPVNKTCLICKTNENATCVLVAIDGTVQDGIAECVPIHLNCAVATNYSKDVGVLYTKVK